MRRAYCEEGLSSEIQFTMMVFIASMFFLMVGCGGDKLIRIQQQELQNLKSQSDIYVVHYSPAPLLAWRPENRSKERSLLLGFLLGIIGAGADAAIEYQHAKSTGAEMAAQYGLADMAPLVQDRFLPSWQPELGLTQVKAIPQALEEDDAYDLAKQFSGGMVLDFKTTNWSLSFFPKDTSHYRIRYAARARLIRLEDSRIVWQGLCEFNQVDPRSPTLAELTKDDGELLKAKFGDAADSCAGDLLVQFFGRKPATR